MDPTEREQRTSHKNHKPDETVRSHDNFFVGAVLKSSVDEVADIDLEQSHGYTCEDELEVPEEVAGDGLEDGPVEDLSFMEVVGEEVDEGVVDGDEEDEALETVE